MMAYSHACSGAAVWLAMVPAVSLLTPVGPKEVVLGAVVTAGAALLPDLDHASSTASKSLGGRWVGRLVAHASGGHRQGTHSLLACLVLALLAQLAAWLGWAWLPVLLTLWIGLRGLRLVRSKKGSVITLLACLGVAVALSAAGGGMPWLGLAIGAGALAHLLGDALTPEGVPLMWAPWHRHARRYTLSLFTTNTWPERWVVTPILVAGICLLGGLDLLG